MDSTIRHVNIERSKRIEWSAFHSTLSVFVYARISGLRIELRVRRPGVENAPASDACGTGTGRQEGDSSDSS
jgi:hypothetical protein